MREGSPSVAVDLSNDSYECRIGLASYILERPASIRALLLDWFFLNYMCPIDSD